MTHAGSSTGSCADTKGISFLQKYLFLNKNYIHKLIFRGIYIISGVIIASIFALDSRPSATCQSPTKIPSIGRAQKGSREGFYVVFKLRKNPKLAPDQSKAALHEKVAILPVSEVVRLRPRQDPSRES